MPSSLLARFSQSHSTEHLQFHQRQVFGCARVETTVEESGCIKPPFQMPMPLCHPSSLAISKTKVFICPNPHQSISLSLGDAQHSAADRSKYQRCLYKQAKVKSNISKRFDFQICTSSQGKAEGSSNAGTPLQWKA